MCHIYLCNFSSQTQFFKDANKGKNYKYVPYMQRLCNQSDGSQMPKPKEGFDSTASGVNDDGGSKKTPWNVRFEGTVYFNVEESYIGEVSVLIGGTNSFEHYLLNRSHLHYISLPNGNLFKKNISRYVTIFKKYFFRQTEEKQDCIDRKGNRSRLHYKAIFNRRWLESSSYQRYGPRRVPLATAAKNEWWSTSRSCRIS